MSTIDLQNKLKALGAGESWTISRDDFRDACDTDDKLVYLTIARRMAHANKYYVTINEDTLVFDPRS